MSKGKVIGTEAMFLEGQSWDDISLSIRKMIEKEWSDYVYEDRGAVEEYRKATIVDELNGLRNLVNGVAGGEYSGSVHISLHDVDGEVIREENIWKAVLKDGDLWIVVKNKEYEERIFRTVMFVTHEIWGKHSSSVKDEEEGRVYSFTKL